jgi:hypothetical protein
MRRYYQWPVPKICLRKYRTLRAIDESCGRWSSRLSFENLAIAERHLKRELELGIVFVARAALVAVIIASAAIAMGAPSSRGAEQGNHVPNMKVDGDLDLYLCTEALTGWRKQRCWFPLVLGP